MKIRLTLAAAAFLVTLPGLPTSAGTAANPFAALLRARAYADVERLAVARLASDPGDVDALVAKADAIVALDPDGRADEAIGLAGQCVAAHPQSSNCYLAAGNALGAKARHANPIAAIRDATRIRDDFSRAVELDPHNTDARFALLDYYLHAPLLVGGGLARARALAAQTEAVDPAVARLMRAQLALAHNDGAAAEAILLASQPGLDEMAADRQRDLLRVLAQQYRAAGRLADAERILRLVR